MKLPDKKSSFLNDLSSILGHRTKIGGIIKTIDQVQRWYNDNNQTTTASTNSGNLTPTPFYKPFSIKNDDFLRTLAILSADSYGKMHLTLPSGCKQCYEFNTGTGLHGKLYQLRTGEYVCAFAGTDSAWDMVENGLQIFGISPQYQDALRVATEIVGTLSSNIIFTGHSQGGGEAAYCAYSLGLKAVTFNSAGLSDFTIKNIDRSKFQKADIHSYIFGLDLVDALQKFLRKRAPEFDIVADGHIHQVTDYIPGKISISHFHGMKGILNYFGVPVF